MAGYTSNTLSLMSVSPLAVGPQMWMYTTTTDSEATVKGAGYISDATKKGMEKGDIVWVINPSTPAGYLLMCSAISSGAGTLAADIVVT